MDAKSDVAEAVCRALFTKLLSENFYGSVEAVFEKGRIVRIKKHEILLEDDVRKIIEA